MITTTTIATLLLYAASADPAPVEHTIAVMALKPATAAATDDAKVESAALVDAVRAAVVVDELDASGKPVSFGRVAACVQGDLVQRGVPVVSADQAKRIHAKIDPSHPLAEQAVDNLDAVDVDVILSGSVHYSDA